MARFHQTSEGVIEFTPTEEAEADAAEAAWISGANDRMEASARVTRDALLAATDFYALSDVSMSEAMTTYRSDLRAVPTLSGFPNDFEWPTAP